jgi:hypothetical protein
VWGYRQGTAGGDVTGSSRCPVVLEEEFRIEGIRCYCILGVNSHERVEKQAVIVSLEFKGPGQLAWGSTVVDTYQAMTRAIAEVCSYSPWQQLTANIIYCSAWKRLRSRPSRRSRPLWPEFPRLTMPTSE